MVLFTTGNDDVILDRQPSRLIFCEKEPAEKFVRKAYKLRGQRKPGGIPAVRERTATILSRTTGSVPDFPKIPAGFPPFSAWSHGITRWSILDFVEDKTGFFPRAIIEACSLPFSLSFSFSSSLFQLSLPSFLPPSRFISLFPPLSPSFSPSLSLSLFLRPFFFPSRPDFSRALSPSERVNS